MSQEQLRRRPNMEQEEPIKYGDVFNVTGGLSSQPITPEDASTMQSAESKTLGKTQKGGPAATMQSAAAANERHGAVGHHNITNVAKDLGVTVKETDVGAKRVVTEAVGDQVVGQYTPPATGQVESTVPPFITGSPITIGEALEASALGAGDKPVDQSDAAAIQAAEVRAAGSNEVLPGGIGATAQSAATRNVRALGGEDKIKLGDVLEDATSKLPADKPSRRKDAKGVTNAEIRNSPGMAAHPGGVADSVAAAAKLNMQQ